MLNPIEKFKSSILYLNRDWNHCVSNLQSGALFIILHGIIRKHDGQVSMYT